MVKGKRILVTGGAGMIGSCLVRRLINLGAEVIVVDNLWRTKKRDNLVEKGELIIPEENLHTLDLSSYENAVKICKDVDIIVHLAEIVAGIGFVFANQGFLFRKNIQINSNVYTAAKNNGITKILYVGTVCSHPQEKQNESFPPPLKEDEIYPANPESAYGWSKLMGEYELELLKKENPKIDICILRLHNVYGPNCDINPKTSQVIPSLIKKIIENNKEISVWGSGLQTRDFIYVEDVVNAIILGLKKGWNKGAIQIGSGKATSIRDIAKTAINLSGKNIKIKYDLTKPEGDKGRVADYSRAKKILGWQPQTGLKTGIKNTYNSIKKEIYKLDKDVIISDYFFENKKKISFKKVENKKIPQEIYEKIHAQMVIPCHDVFISYKGGILLAKRKNKPSKGALWPIGGKMQRGKTKEDSLKNLVKKECGLNISNLKILGISSTGFLTDPFEHGSGTHTSNIVFFAEGEGKINLNEGYEKYLLVTPQEYTSKMKKNLHPFVRDYLDLAINKI